MITVTFYGASSDLAGCMSQTYPGRPEGKRPATMGELWAMIGAGTPSCADPEALTGIAPICTLLVDGVPFTMDAGQLPETYSTVDVLPPFAGG